MRNNRFALPIFIAAIFSLLCSVSPAQTASPAALSSAGISQAMYQKMYAANATWKRREGFGLEATLSIAKGKPTLFLEASKGASADDISSRFLALITAFEFILSPDGFDRVRIVITESTPGRRTDRTVRDFELTRAQFQLAVTSVAKTTTAEDGVKVVRRDRTVRDQIGTQLGIK